MKNENVCIKFEKFRCIKIYMKTTFNAIAVLNERIYISNAFLCIVEQYF